MVSREHCRYGNSYHSHTTHTRVDNIVEESDATRRRNALEAVSMAEELRNRGICPDEDENGKVCGARLSCPNGSCPRCAAAAAKRAAAEERFRELMERSVAETAHRISQQKVSALIRRTRLERGCCPAHDYLHPPERPCDACAKDQDLAWRKFWFNLFACCLPGLALFFMVAALSLAVYIST